MAFSFFSGSGANSVTIEIKGEVTTQSEKIVYEVTNHSLPTVWMGNEFVLEIKEDGEWVEVEQIAPVTHIAWKVGRILPTEQSIDIVEVFGKTLDAGEYRLTKPYADTACSVEFVVTEA